MDNGGPSFAHVVQKIVIFRGVRKLSSELHDFQLKLLILIKSSNKFHLKPEKKIKVGVILGQNFCQIKSIFVKK